MMVNCILEGIDALVSTPSWIELSLWEESAVTLVKEFATDQPGTIQYYSAYRYTRLVVNGEIYFAWVEGVMKIDRRETFLKRYGRLSIHTPIEKPQPMVKKNRYRMEVGGWTR